MHEPPQSVADLTPCSERQRALSNALIESTNTKIRVITRTAFGFTDPHALIALAMLTLGGYRPTLPGRAST